MQDDHEELGPRPSAHRWRRPAPGGVDTTEAKIRIDIPLPIPRWVISSASHITSAVPAVQVRTISAAVPTR